MLTDNSLTNIITLSGISNIKYKLFTESCSKSNLIAILTLEKEHFDSTSNNPPSNLIQAYKELTKLNIPSIWQPIINSNYQKSDSIVVELWIFWFNDEYLSVINQLSHLKNLTESKSGSFQWSQWCSNGSSPMSSPKPSAKTPTTSLNLVPGHEYRLFIKSIRQLIQQAMIIERKGFVLGEFFVFVKHYLDEDDIMLDRFSPADDLKKTMLGCTYNIYLTHSNIVFQPNVRRMRIRPLNLYDLNVKDLKVLLSPTGELATIVSFHTFPTVESQQHALNCWSEFLSIPSDYLKHPTLPSLVMVQTSSHEMALYPTNLSFVPTDTKESPSAVAGMNGIMGHNHGLVQDLSAKLIAPNSKILPSLLTHPKPITPISEPVTISPLIQTTPLKPSPTPKQYPQRTTLDRPHHLPMNCSQPTLDCPQSTLDCPQSTLDCPQPTLDCPQPILDYPQPILDYPQPTLDYPQPTLDYPQPTLDYPQPTLDYPQPTLWDQMDITEEDFDFFATPCKRPATEITQEPPIEEPSEPRAITNTIPPDFLPVSIPSEPLHPKYINGKFMYSAHPVSSTSYTPDYIPNRTPPKKTPSIPDVILTSDDSSSSSSEDDTMSWSDSSENPWDALVNFRKSIAQRWIRATPAVYPVDRLRQLDYDVPFATRLLEDGVWVGKPNDGVMRWLWQQAVWGGYPFSGRLAEVLSDRGGEMASEPDKVLVAVRTNLMQVTRGVVTHVPSIQAERTKLTLDFKEILKGIFVRSMGAVKDKLSDPYVPLVGELSIQGPLSIQQYYQLNDNQQQGNIRYGKYQVKKKRPSEPNLDTLKNPSIIVSRHDEYLEGSAKMITFWEKLALNPYSSKKQIKYFVIYPSGNDKNEIDMSIQTFFKELDTVYTTCHLGLHEPFKDSTYLNGLIPVSYPLTESDLQQHILTSYEKVCTELGAQLANQTETESYHTVIYIINPKSSIVSYLDMCRCFDILQKSYFKTNPNRYKKSYTRLVLQLIPLDHILKGSAFRGYLLQGMKDIAFSVYSKCFLIATRKKSNKTDSVRIYAPPFILSKPIPKPIRFQLNRPQSFPTLLETNVKLHMAYCFSYDRAWMIVVWTDDRGELLEHGIFHRKTAYPSAWERTLEIAARTGVRWTIVVAKLGLMFGDERTTWDRVIGSDYAVVIVSVDLESSLHLHVGASGEAQVLVLNHRVCYSQKREKAFKGILRLEAVSEKENWMIPLATGYLIHHSLSNKNLNPCMEQFNNEPFTAEVHLLLNQTRDSAYNTLQEIIKNLYALSFINPISSSHSCIPHHMVLVERLSRLLLIIDGSMK